MLCLHNTLTKWNGSFLSDRLIVNRVDDFFSNAYLINAVVLQGSIIAPVPFILFIDDLLSLISSSIHSFADDTFLSSSFSYDSYDHAYSDTPLHRSKPSSLLTNDLTVIEKWSKDNLVLFNQSRTKQAVISRKQNQNLPPVLMSGNEVENSTSFAQLGFSVSSNLIWKSQSIPLLNMHLNTLIFPFRFRGFHLH